MHSTHIESQKSGLQDDLAIEAPYARFPSVPTNPFQFPIYGNHLPRLFAFSSVAIFLTFRAAVNTLAMNGPYLVPCVGTDTDSEPAESSYRRKSISWPEEKVAALLDKGGRASQISLVYVFVVITFMVLPSANPVLAVAPNVPYGPGKLYKMSDGSAFWRGSAMPQTYYVNVNSIPAGLGIDAGQFEAACTGAFATWENDLGSIWDVTYGGRTDRIHKVSNQAIYTWDGYNDIFFVDLYGTAPGNKHENLTNALALCLTNYDWLTGRIIESDIAIDIYDPNGAPRPWVIGAVDNSYDLQSTITHEAGHFLGLDDIPFTGFADDNQLTMYYSMAQASLKARSLEKGDLAGLRFIYGGQKQIDGGIGYHQAGADGDIAQIDGVGGLDMICAWVDDPSGNNFIYYRYGFNIDVNSGMAGTWSNRYQWTTNIGKYTSGLGVALAYIDLDNIIDAVFAWCDNPSGQDAVKYVIGWDLSALGVPASWSSVKTVPSAGIGNNNNGMDIDIENLAGTARPDLVLAWVDNPGSGNAAVRYKIGKDMGTTGIIGDTSWTTWSTFATNVPYHNVQDCGVGVADFDSNGAKDIMFAIMEYHTGPDGNNKMTYKIGWNVDATWAITGWTGWTNGPVGWIGTETDGFGVACAQLDNYASEEVFYFWVDDPLNQNSVYYRIEWEGRVAGSH
jgi:hypothetical protein